MTGTRGYRFGPFLLDVERVALVRDGEEIALRSKSFDVSRYLVRHPQRLVSANYGHILFGTGRFDEAATAFSAVAALNPEKSFVDLAVQVWIGLLREDCATASELAEELPPGLLLDQAQAMLAFAAGDRAATDAALARIRESADPTHRPARPRYMPSAASTTPRSRRWMPRSKTSWPCPIELRVGISVSSFALRLFYGRCTRMLVGTPG